MELVKSVYDVGKIQWHPLDPVSESTGIQWVSMTFPAPGILLDKFYRCKVRHKTEKYMENNGSRTWNQPNLFNDCFADHVYDQVQPPHARRENGCHLDDERMSWPCS